MGKHTLPHVFWLKVCAILDMPFDSPEDAVVDRLLALTEDYVPTMPRMVPAVPSLLPANDVGDADAVTPVRELGIARKTYMVG